MPETAKSHEKEAAQMRRAELILEERSLDDMLEQLRYRLDETREQIRAMNRLLESDDA